MGTERDKKWIVTYKLFNQESIGLINIRNARCCKGRVGPSWSMYCPVSLIESHGFLLESCWSWISPWGWMIPATRGPTATRNGDWTSRNVILINKHWWSKPTFEKREPRQTWACDPKNLATPKRMGTQSAVESIRRQRYWIVNKRAMGSEGHQHSSAPLGSPDTFFAHTQQCQKDPPELGGAEKHLARLRNLCWAVLKAQTLVNNHSIWLSG